MRFGLFLNFVFGSIMGTLLQKIWLKSPLLHILSSRINRMCFGVGGRVCSVVVILQSSAMAMSEYVDTTESAGLQEVHLVTSGLLLCSHNILIYIEF